MMDELVKAQLEACYNEILDKTKLNSELVHLLDAYRFLYFYLFV